jgi:hypothetical protein
MKKPGIVKKMTALKKPVYKPKKSGKKKCCG